MIIEHVHESAIPFTINGVINFIDHYIQAQTQIKTNSVIKPGLFKTMERMISEFEIDIAMNQLRNYRYATGAFGMKRAISRRNKIQPYEWWMQYGSDTPILTKFTIKVLTQTCSTSPCERNWSTFDHREDSKKGSLMVIVIKFF